MIETLSQYFIFLCCILISSAVPVGVPSNVIVTAEDSTTIKVRWTPPAAWTIRGNLLGYKVIRICLLLCHVFADSSC